MRNKQNQSKLTKVSEGTQGQGKESNNKTEGEWFRRKLLSEHPEGQRLAKGSPFSGLNSTEKKELSRRIIENVSAKNKYLQEKAGIIGEGTREEKITVGGMEQLLSSVQKDDTDSETVVGSPPQIVSNYFEDFFSTIVNFA